MMDPLDRRYAHAERHATRDLPHHAPYAAQRVEVGAGELGAYGLVAAVVHRNASRHEGLGGVCRYDLASQAFADRLDIDYG